MNGPRTLHAQPVTRPATVREQRTDSSPIARGEPMGSECDESPRPSRRKKYPISQDSSRVRWKGSNGQGMGCPRTVHGVPTSCQLAARYLSADCPRTVHGPSADFLLIVRGLSMGCLRSVNRLVMDYPGDICGRSAGCPRTVQGLSAA